MACHKLFYLAANTKTMQIESPVASVDTNEEYIQPQNAIREPAVLSTVFKAVIVDTVKDFFGSIFGFFYRYIRHFLRSFLYVWNPGLRKKPLDKLDYKENCQHSIELALLVLFMIIFAVKLEWIPETSKENLDILNNDLTQMSLQFMWFIIFAIAYFVMAIICVVSGRFLRSLLKIKITKRESDILFLYLNNAFFSISAIIALIIRSITSLETTDQETLMNGLLTIITPLVFLFILLWALRFSIVNKLGFLKSTVFFGFSLISYTILFTLGCYITVVFLIVI